MGASGVEQESKARRVPLATGAPSGSQSHAPSGVVAPPLLRSDFCGEEHWVKNGPIPAGEFYYRERGSTEDTGNRQYAGSRGVAPSLQEPDGSCRPAHSLPGSALGPWMRAHLWRREDLLGARGLAQIWGDCHSAAEGGVVWSENLHRCGSVPHRPDLSLRSARPESESGRSIVLSMGRRGEKRVKP